MSSVAFVSWGGARRACPLASFGSRSPSTLHACLAFADPPRADQPTLKNAQELQGAVALVVRGGCSFAHKARLLQRAGAAGMLLANNTREEPLAAFTMAESAQDEGEQVTIPCFMMCLKDVRELLKKFPPTSKNGELLLEILGQEEQQQALEELKSGWSLKETTRSLLKLLETDVKLQESEEVKEEEPVEEAKQPPLAFVQWGTSSSSFEVRFAPMADFSAAEAGTEFAGKLVQCEPLQGDQSVANAKKLRGAIALLQRGACSFPEKIERVQRAGAVAAIVGNDDDKDPDAAFVMSVDRIDAANATLPAVMVSKNVFERLQQATENTVRILCVSGEAAGGLLAASGESVSFAELAMPAPTLSTDAAGGAENLLFDLHVVCREGDHGACQRVLAQLKGEEQKRDLVRKACPSNGLTALHHASAGGNDNIVEMLLQLGAAPDATDWAMQTPLHVACAHRNLACARLLLRAEGATAAQVPQALYNVEEKYGGISTLRDIGGRTAMHEAALAGSAECIELLLAANARVDSIDQEGAASNKYVFLGVSANDLEGSSPLHIACVHAHAECALYLIAANADVNSKDVEGNSPMLLACEAANDPSKEASAAEIIDKLISSGAAMEELEDNAESDEGPLLLDRIKSMELRRDLEVRYLRHEAREARQSSSRLELENNTMKEKLQGLATQLSALQNRVASQEAQGQQIQDLRMQMQTMMQFLSMQRTSNATAGVLSAASDSTAMSPLLSIDLTRPTGRKEEELALDAALARDLGKKCLREGQHALAEKYFQRSLELLPLPGVHQLLDKAKTTRTNEAEATQQSTALGSIEAQSARLPVSSTKDTAIQRLRNSLQKPGVSPEARTMLEREITKLEGLESGPAFEEACRWTEWLMALPWGDPSSGLQNEDLYESKRDLFNRLDELESECKQSHRGQAARTIQRAFRDRYAVHLRTRATAATRIQALVRGQLTRQYYESSKHHHHLREKAFSSQNLSRQGSAEASEALATDYTVTVDPTLYRQLQPDCRVEALVVGRFMRYDYSPSASVDVSGMFRVIQLVQCVLSKMERYTSALFTSEQEVVFFVWTRWGRNVDDKCQCSLGGPYDDEHDAQRRFDRILRDAHNQHAVTACSPRKESSEGQSGFAFLRSVLASDASIASA